jgi:hypothetical protein
VRDNVQKTTMTNTDNTLQKTMLELPAEVDFVFADARTTPEVRNAYMYALRSAGWTLQAISESSGLTRERVRQIVKDFTENGDKVALVAGPVPVPPAKAVKEPREYVEPDPAKLNRLLAIQSLARKSRGTGSRYQAEGDEYTALVADVHLNDGVPLYRLSKRLSEQPEQYGTVSHAALRFRLARYRYKLPEGEQAGKSKVYTPIADTSRHGGA